MTIHVLKCWPKHFEAVDNGSKPFELRYNDRGFKVGDVLLLDEWQPSAAYAIFKTGTYTGRKCMRSVTYVLDEFEEMPEFTPDGWVILGIKPLEGEQ